MKAKDLLQVVAMAALVPFAAQANLNTETSAGAAQVVQATQAQSAASQLDVLRSRVNPGYYKGLDGLVCHSTEGAKGGNGNA